MEADTDTVSAAGEADNNTCSQGVSECMTVQCLRSYIQIHTHTHTQRTSNICWWGGRLSFDLCLPLLLYILGIVFNSLCQRFTYLCKHLFLLLLMVYSTWCFIIRSSLAVKAARRNSGYISCLTATRSTVVFPAWSNHVCVSLCLLSVFKLPPYIRLRLHLTVEKNLFISSKYS